MKSMKRSVAALILCVFVLSIFAYAGEKPKPQVLKGWISDSECAAHGDYKCGDKSHIAQGAKLVFVTEGDNKVLTVSNPSAVADHQGHHVQIKGTTDSEESTVTVQQVKMLK